RSLGDPGGLPARRRQLPHRLQVGRRSLRNLRPAAMVERARHSDPVALGKKANDMTTKTLLAAATGTLALIAFPSAAAATVAPVPAPAIPGVAGLPGPLAGPSTASPNMGILKATPDTGAAGAAFTLSGTKLPAGKQVQIVWYTSKVDWLLDARPDSVDYIGQQETEGVGGVVRTTTTRGARAL